MAKTTKQPAAPKPSPPPPAVGDVVLYCARADFGGTEDRAAIVAGVADGGAVALHVFPAAADAYRLADVPRDESGKTVGTWRSR